MSPSLHALVLVNSLSPQHQRRAPYVLAYLEHWGVPHQILDLAHTPLPTNVADFPLLIVAHEEMDVDSARLGPLGRERLLAAVRMGAGLVSFDPYLPAGREWGASSTRQGTWVDHLLFTGVHHYITAGHDADELLPLAARLRVHALSTEGTTLVSAAGQPFLSSIRLGQGRLVRWATNAWMRSDILGPLGGLDDVLWRSLVWAARKPFVMRGLPPLVTMRVDDVAATGAMWGKTPLYWVQEANRHGFKPWLGIFPYNLSEPAVNELRDLIQRGQATAFPHALGLRSRPRLIGVSYQGAFPSQATRVDEEEFARRHGRRPGPSDLDEFIYFDHINGRPWPDTEASKRLAAVDEWYAAHAPLPMSRYFVPHWGEMGVNVLPHIYGRWGARFCMTLIDAGQRYHVNTPWLRLGPFRRHEPPGTAAIDPRRRGLRPVYYADFINLAGYRFFYACTEIRDDAGYDWRPNSDVATTIGHGVRQLRRALDSMALAVLVAHETDHIYHIPPEAWAQAIAGVARGIAGYEPRFVTLDEGIQYVQATITSALRSAVYDPQGRQVIVTLSGQADVPTHFHLFIEEHDAIAVRLVGVPPFAGETSVIAPL